MQTFTCVGDSFLHLRQNNINNRGPKLEVIFGLRQLASVLGVRGLGVGMQALGSGSYMCSGPLGELFAIFWSQILNL